MNNVMAIAINPNARYRLVICIAFEIEQAT